MNQSSPTRIEYIFRVDREHTKENDGQEDQQETTGALNDVSKQPSSGYLPSNKTESTFSIEQEDLSTSSSEHKSFIEQKSVILADNILTEIPTSGTNRSDETVFKHEQRVNVLEEQLEEHQIYISSLQRELEYYMGELMQIGRDQDNPEEDNDEQQESQARILEQLKAKEAENLSMRDHILEKETKIAHLEAQVLKLEMENQFLHGGEHVAVAAALDDSASSQREHHVDWVMSEQFVKRPLLWTTSDSIFGEEQLLAEIEMDSITEIQQPETMEEVDFDGREFQDANQLLLGNRLLISKTLDYGGGDDYDSHGSDDHDNDVKHGDDLGAFLNALGRKHMKAEVQTDSYQDKVTADQTIRPRNDFVMSTGLMINASIATPIPMNRCSGDAAMRIYTPTDASKSLVQSTPSTVSTGKSIESFESFEKLNTPISSPDRYADGITRLALEPSTGNSAINCSCETTDVSPPVDTNILEVDYAVVKEQLNQSQQEIIKMKEKLVAFQEEAKTRETTLLDDLRATEMRLKGQEKELSSLRQEYKMQRETLHERQNELTKTHEQLASKEAIICRLNKRVAAESRERAEKETEIWRHANLELARCQSTIKQISSALEQTQHDHIAFKKQAKSLEASLTNRLETGKTETARLVLEAENLKQLSREMEISLSCREKEIENIQNQWRRQNNMHEEERVKLNQAVAKLEEERKELQKELALKQQQNSRSQRIEEAWEPLVLGMIQQEGLALEI